MSLELTYRKELPQPKQEQPKLDEKPKPKPKPKHKPIITPDITLRAVAACDYLKLAREKGMYTAVSQLEEDIINSFHVDVSVAEMARRLRLQRTTLAMKMKKMKLNRDTKSEEEA